MYFFLILNINTSVVVCFSSHSFNAMKIPSDSIFEGGFCDLEPPYPAVNTSTI